MLESPPRIEPFRKTVSRAAFLMLGSHFLSQALRMAGSLVLTRLLVPDAFGVMMVATVVWTGLVMLSDLGFKQVIIRSPNGGSPEFLDTVWTLQLLQGALIAAVLVIGAAALAAAQGLNVFPTSSTYAHPQLPWVVASLSVAAVLAAAQSTSIDLANRDLRLGSVLQLEIGSQLLALGVTIVCAWPLEMGVYSLVAGACSAAGCKTLLSHVAVRGPRHRLFISRTATREIVRFGRWIVLTSCAGFLIGNGDRLLLAWLLPSREMGNYAIATLLLFAVHDLIGKVLARVVYPALSTAVNVDPLALRRAYLEARRRVDAGCLVVAGLLMTCGDLVIRLLYDHRYDAAGLYLSALALSLLGVRYRVLSQVFMVLDQPRLMLYEQVSHAVALVVGVLLGFHAYGATGAVVGVALSYLAAQIWNAFVAQTRLGLLDLRLELRSLALFTIVVAAVAATRFLRF